MTQITQDYLDGFKDAQITIAETFEMLSQFETEQSSFFLELGQIIRNLNIMQELHPPRNFRDVANGE